MYRPSYSTGLHYFNTFFVSKNRFNITLVEFTDNQQDRTTRVSVGSRS